MANQCIAQTPSAYGFPLLIKGLLESGVTRAPEQEIVSGNQNRSPIGSSPSGSEGSPQVSRAWG